MKTEGKSVKEVREAWCAALRSGKYNQARGQLAELPIVGQDSNGFEVHGKEPVGHCCLGVLCEVLGAAYEPTDGEPHFVVVDAAGLGGAMVNKLVNMNDGWGGAKHFPPVRRHTFLEIADYIETLPLPE